MAQIRFTSGEGRRVSKIIITIKPPIPARPDATENTVQALSDDLPFAP